MVVNQQKIEKFFKQAFVAIFYLLVFLLLLKSSFSYLDPDFGWHLKVGEGVFKSLAVPDLNVYNHTLVGTHWVDHEWLANLGIYIVYNSWGYIALSVLFAALVLGILIIQLKFAKKYFLKDNKGVLIFLALQFFGLYASLPHLGVRVQELTVLFLLLVLMAIYDFEKSGRYRNLLWLLPLFIFWACVHAGFLIGFFVLGLYVVTKLLALVFKNILKEKFFDFGRFLDLKQVGALSGILLAYVSVTLFTPYGFRLYGFLNDCRDTFFQAHISEWQPQFFYPFLYPQLLYLDLVLLVFVLVALDWFLFKSGRRQKINLWNFSLLLVFSVLAFKARRHFPLLFVVSVPIVSAYLIDFFGLRFKMPDSVIIAIKKFRVILWVVSCLCLLAVSVIILGSVKFSNHPEIIFQSSYPYQAIKFLQNHPEWSDRKMFNEYGWGGYLIWQYPQQQLFIDGRLPQYRLNGSTILQEYFSFFDKDEAGQKLAQYGINMAILGVKQVMPRPKWWEKLFFGIQIKDIEKAENEKFYLNDYLRKNSQWQAVYKDDLSEIFIKN